MKNCWGWRELGSPDGVMAYNSELIPLLVKWDGLFENVTELWRFDGSFVSTQCPNFLLVTGANVIICREQILRN